jgi:hypothetical protein
MSGWEQQPLPNLLLKLNILNYSGHYVNIDTLKKTTQALIDASKEVGLKVDTEKTKYMLLFRHQNAGQNRDIKIASRRSKNVAQFRYLGTTITGL